MKGFKETALAAALVLIAGFVPAASARAQGRDSVVRLLDAARGARIGVSVHDADESDAKDGKQAKAGVIVDSVDPDGAADKAGVKSGDVIVEFDGEKVRSVRQFSRLVQETPAGHAVEMALARGGQRVTVTVAASRPSYDDDGAMRLFEAPFANRLMPSMPPAPPAAPAAPRGPRAIPPTPPAMPLETYSFSSGRRLGLTVETLDEQLAQYFGVKDGVLVRSVVADSAGQKAGVKAGDVITGVNGRQIYEVSDVNRAIDRMDSTDEFTLEIVREHKTQTVKGKLEPRGRSRGMYF